jgi:hypothetical protein
MYRVTLSFFPTSRFAQKTANQKKKEAERHEGMGCPKVLVRIRETSALLNV